MKLPKKRNVFGCISIRERERGREGEETYEEGRVNVIEVRNSVG